MPASLTQQVSLPVLCCTGLTHVAAPPPHNALPGVAHACVMLVRRPPRKYYVGGLACAEIPCCVKVYGKQQCSEVVMSKLLRFAHFCECVSRYNRVNLLDAAQRSSVARVGQNKLATFKDTSVVMLAREYPVYRRP